MYLFLFCAVVGFVVWLFTKVGSSAGTLGVLGAGKLAGRGLVLTSNPIATGVTILGRRFEQRTMTIEVEVEGRPPYLLNGVFNIPRGLVEAIPGASLDLEVDPKNPNMVSVLGPGGFTGPWLRPGPPAAY